MSALTAAGSTRRWRRIRAFVLDRDLHRCQLWVDVNGDHVDDGDPAWQRRCLAWASHVDHIVERQAGGTDDPSNLRAACAVGNLSRRPFGQSPNGPNVVRPASQESVRSWSW